MKQLSAALEPLAKGALYLNYLSRETGDPGVRAAYGANYERLAALKRKYDPTNFFRFNRNIRPQASGIDLTKGALFSGPDLPPDEMARRRFFGEE